MPEHAAAKLAHARELLPVQAEAELAFDESPCDLCPNFKKCKAEILACQAFIVFVREGARRWTAAERKPSRALYDEIYHDAPVEQVAA
ncbi:MAG: hypothetical protein ACLQT5_01165 [Steroidobacteraceae bacterium]